MITRCFSALFLALCFSACVSGPVNIPQHLTPAELIQRGQEAAERKKYDTALKYYNALYERNRDNIDLVITAEYEIAFISFKQNNYQMARDKLNGVLKYYEDPDAELLPQHFKILANIVLARIDEKENERTLFSARKK